MSTVIGSVMMLFFACVAMRAMTNYKLVSGERAKKNIINGYKLVIVLAFLGAILLFIDF